MPINKKYPKVSCYLITYNQENTVEEAIKSALDQDYPNYEIVISDDGSSDKTPDIIESYKKLHPDKIIALTRQSHLGITLNANRTLEHCTGDYVAFLAGDDIWLPNKIKKQIEWFDRYPHMGVCYHDVTCFNHDNPEEKIMFSQIMKPRSGNIQKILPYGCFAGSCSIMFKRFEAKNLFFNKDLPHVSDWFFILDFLAETKLEIGMMEDTFALYRRHNQSITKKIDLFDEMIEGYKLFSANHNSLAPYVEKVLNNTFVGAMKKSLLEMRISDFFKFYRQSKLNIYTIFKTLLIKVIDKVGVKNICQTL